MHAAVSLNKNACTVPPVLVAYQVTTSCAQLLPAFNSTELEVLVQPEQPLLSPTFHLPSAPASISHLMEQLSPVTYQKSSASCLVVPSLASPARIGVGEKIRNDVGGFAVLLEAAVLEVHLNCTSLVYGLQVVGNLCLT